MTPEREAALRRFLRQAGWAQNTLSPLAGDASPRRYYRIGSAAEAPSRRAVLMDDADGGPETVGRFAALSRHLCDLGFHAPRVMASDLAEGILLLEDLGDDLLARLLQHRPFLEGRCYEAAVDLLAALRRYPPPPAVCFEGIRHRINPYDRDPLVAEAALLTDWWLPGTDASADEPTQAEYRSLVADAVEGATRCRDVLVLRDYHAENLLWLESSGGEAWQRIGVLDFQDALSGHPAYDLVSLLEDARRDTTPALREAMHVRYAAQTEMSREERSEFRAVSAALGAQRNLKILGIFARLCIRDGKPGYLDLMPRVWGHLLEDLAHPRLAALGGWVRAHAPEPTPAMLARVRAKKSVT